MEKKSASPHLSPPAPPALSSLAWNLVLRGSVRLGSYLWREDYYDNRKQGGRAGKKAGKNVYRKINTVLGTYWPYRHYLRFIILPVPIPKAQLPHQYFNVYYLSVLFPFHLWF